MTSNILIRLCKSPNAILRNAFTPGLPFRINRFAGHAKWQNIRSTKMANDMAKCKTISRYVQLVRRAIVLNNYQSDPRLNGKLNDVLAEAQKFNVPKATLERAIVRAANVKVKSVVVEALGPGGSAVVIRCETENIGSLRRELKKVFRKYDTTIMSEGSSVKNMFKSQGFIRTEIKTADGREISQDFAEEAAILADAQEVSLENYEDAKDENLSQMFVFSTDADTINNCKGELEKQGFKIVSYDLELVPYRSVDFGSDVYEKLVDLRRELQEMDQVLDVFHNVASPAEEAVAIS